jgi:hypothetical protein
MELLLNLAWMLLALPAYWLWRRGGGAQVARRLSALQGLLTLGCALVLLFPVISASDDLHAMRAEMEDSSTSKRAVRQAVGDKTSAWGHRGHGAPALAVSALWFPAAEITGIDGLIADLSPLYRLCVPDAGRAPPSFFLLA